MRTAMEDDLIIQYLLLLILIFSKKLVRVGVRTAFLESQFRRTAMEDDLIMQYLLLLILFFYEKIG